MERGDEVERGDGSEEGREGATRCLAAASGVKTPPYRGDHTLNAKHFRGKAS